METSVSRRETILTRGEFQQKLPQNKAVMQSTIQKKITDVQRKIREATQVSSHVLNIRITIRGYFISHLIKSWSFFNFIIASFWP
jgi:hypothetical protein